MDETRKPTFWDDPVDYCRGRYQEYSRHNDRQRNRIVDNRKFYEGIDEKLEERKANAKVARSAAFVSEARPVIDTMIAGIVDALLQQENPVTLMMNLDAPDFDESALNILEERLNDELRSCGFLINLFQESLQGAALMPLVVGKMGWEDKEGWAYKKTPALKRKLGQFLYMLGVQKKLPEPVFKTWEVIKSSPYIEILDYDEFLYDHTVDNLDNAECLIHARYRTMANIEAEAAYCDYDLKVIEQMKEDLLNMAEAETGTAGNIGNTGIVDEVATELENKEGGYRDGKVLVCETWIPVKDEAGRDETRIFTMAALRYKLSRGKFGRRSPWDKFKYPFTIMRFNKQFNRLEGTPPIELIKDIQRIYNDNINAYLDYLGYNVFPVLIRAQGTSIAGNPRFGPGEVWDVTNPDGLKPLHVPAGDINALIPFSEMIAAKMRQIVASADLSQGIPGAEQEKATKTIERARGTATRNKVPAKAAGDFIIAVAQMFIGMHQMMGDEEWLLDLVVDVPALTGAKSIEEDQQELLFLLEQAKTNPVYQTPTGLRKLRAFTERVYLKFRLRDIDQILPTQQELDLLDPASYLLESKAKQIQSELDLPPQPEQVVAAGGQQEGTNATV